MIRAACLALIACPAGAEVLQMPQGCVPLASVQHRECQVSLYWRCGEAEGYTSASAGPDGLNWITRRGPTGQWQQMEHGPSGFAFVLEEARDPSDHGAVLARGVDAYDYTMVGPNGASELTYKGTNEDAGNARIGDQEVRVVAYDYQLSDQDGPVRRMQGRAYFWGHLPISISGSWEASDGGASLAEPVEIFTEGEPGFMEMAPRYDCGDQIS